MGNFWSVPSADDIVVQSIDVEHIPRLCAEMHAQYVSWIRSEHWSIVTWYRKLSPDGKVDPHITPLESPVCVIPKTDPLKYSLLNENGDEVLCLDAAEVAEFEDTMYHKSTMSSMWAQVLEGAIIPV